MGCVWAEMFLGRPLLGGNEVVETLVQIIGVTGTKDIESQSGEFEWVNTIIKAGAWDHEVLNGNLGGLAALIENNHVKSLLARCLNWLDTKRPRPQEALDDPCFADIAPVRNI